MVVVVVVVVVVRIVGLETLVVAQILVSLFVETESYQCFPFFQNCPVVGI